MHYNEKLGMYVCGLDSGPIENLHPDSNPFYNWHRKGTETQKPENFRIKDLAKILKDSLKTAKDAYKDIWKEELGKVKEEYSGAFRKIFPGITILSQAADALNRIQIAETKRKGDFIEMVRDENGAYAMKK
jgi:hypothetical protein